MEWNENLKCWECSCGEIAPNWTPDDVKFTEQKKSNLEIALENPIAFFLICLGVMMIVLAAGMLLETLIF